MENKARVHRLPTEDASHIHTLLGEIVYWVDATSNKGRTGKRQPQHLYITTDEEIKEGDWFIHTSHGKSELLRCISSNEKELFGEDDEKWVCWRDYSRKIIATTDPKLHTNEIVEEDMHMYKKSLPQIPQSFIEEYCKAGGIDEVLVEFETIIVNRSRLGLSNIYEDRPKLDSNNCIIIHPVEIDWKIEIQKCKESLWYFMTNYCVVDGKPFKTSMTEEEFNRKWIKKTFKK